MNPHSPAVDFGAVAVIGATIAGWLPVWASIVAIIWYTILIWESDTLRRWRHTRLRRKLVKMEVLEHQLRERLSAKSPMAEEANDLGPGA